MKKIFLVRHCAAYGQHKDSPLTHEGIKQARALTDFFDQQSLMVDKIFTSPYLRAIDSIKPYALNHRIEMNVDDHLQERILSEQPITDWQDELEQSFLDFDYTLPGGESSNDALERANTVLRQIYSDDDLENVIVVSHGNLIALMIHQFNQHYGYEHWRKLENPDIYLICIDHSDTKVERVWE